MPEDAHRPTGRPAVDARAFLRELGGAVGRGDGFDAVLDGVVGAIAATGWDVVLAWALDVDHRRLRLHPARAGDPAAGAALAATSAELTFAPGRGLVGRAWLRRGAHGAHGRRPRVGRRGARRAGRGPGAG